MITWNTAADYDNLLAKSASLGKPILLDLYSSQCKGCVSLDDNIYSHPEVAALLEEHTIPLRVSTDSPDQANTKLINNHIYIWSPTVQLLSNRGVRHHEWYGAPRQTRYSMGYKQTHHEVDGDMTVNKFISQLYVALGKGALREDRIKEAIPYFEKVISDYADDEISLKEARYWLNVAKNHGQIMQMPHDNPTMTMLNISGAIERFSKAATQYADPFILKDWIGTVSADDWQHYTDSLKEVFLQIYQNLTDFHHEVINARENNSDKQTKAQKILADFHMAYRDFQGSVIGVQDKELDLTPFKGERSIRENIVHCILSEWWAHSPQIKHALKLHRANQPASLMPAMDTVEKYGEPVGTFESLNELLTRYEELHLSLLNEFASITDEELEAFSKWWEPEPVKITFRLKRLGWHLRDHKVTIDKIVQAVRHDRTEIELFCQLIYSALGKAESALIGTSSKPFESKLQQLNEFICNRASELEKFFNHDVKLKTATTAEELDA